MCAQRIDSPAAVSGKAKKPKSYISDNVPLRTYAKGGQAEPVLGGGFNSQRYRFCISSSDMGLFRISKVSFTVSSYFMQPIALWHSGQVMIHNGTLFPKAFTIQPPHK